ncbi:glycosyltransferase [Micromonospora sp. WMMD1102]|uniref:glycosyltransferase n=1 Tax=Micromonospora sp. WMMD1102 TaxID=3016105 RepID=UPI00241507BA|nr:glycosyltransferase [Micromonospora sp. WMMD1102]MDG4786345.1 glycosyltransferase [Micromonospora sp. WMMD1102]
MTVPVVSVLLISWNTREETRRCLDSLRVATAGLPYEVVAVDNASTDGSAELLAVDPRVRLVRNPRNVGFAAAVNQAYRQAVGELVLLLNSDVRFHPGALDTMVEFLRLRPDAAGVSPLYLNPDGSFQQHYVQLPTFPAALTLFTALRRVPGFRSALHRFELRGSDFSRPRKLASGSCMLVRRTILEPDRIFDERFPIYWNDAVLTRTLQAAGHQLWMIPHAVVTHTRGASCRLLGTASRFRHLIGGLVGYLRLTQPGYRVGVFRLVLVADHLVKRLCRRQTMLGWRDLTAALRGDVGPLPDGDLRDWTILSADGSWAAEHYFQTVLGARFDDLRVLLVDPPNPALARRLRVRFDGAVWRASPPALVPFAGRLPVVRALNGWHAARLLRRWLDDRPGARVLRLDETSRYLVGRLNEDELVPVGHRPARPEVLL